MRRYMVMAVLLVAANILAQPSLDVRISTPADGARVTYRQKVSGTLSGPNAEVWLVIHPKETSEYWVQPRIAATNDGSWSVTAYIGRSESLDVGKEFEMKAFANVTVSLKEGPAADWPVGQAKSDLLNVVRK